MIESVLILTPSSSFECDAVVFIFLHSSSPNFFPGIPHGPAETRTTWRRIADTEKQERIRSWFFRLRWIEIFRHGICWNIEPIDQSKIPRRTDSRKQELVL